MNLLHPKGFFASSIIHHSRASIKYSYSTNFSIKLHCHLSPNLQAPPKQLSLHKPISWRRYNTLPPSQGPEKPIKGWRKYAYQFRKKPISYTISFAILHEITAVVPIPLVYLFLDKTGINIPVPERVLEEGNKFINKTAKYYGWQGFENGTRVALNAATSYAVVKVLLPARIAACVWMTPWTAEKIVGPIVNVLRRVGGAKA